MSLTDNIGFSVHLVDDFADSGPNNLTPTVSGALIKSTPIMPWGSRNDYGFWDGINDFVSYGTVNDQDYAGNHTFAAVVRTTASGGFDTILDKYTATGPKGYFLGIDAGKPTYICYGNTTFKLAASAVAINDGNTHLVVALYDGTYMWLFVDNVLKDKQAWAYGAEAHADSFFNLGRRAATGLLYWDGDIKEVNMWQRALTHGTTNIGESATGELAQLWCRGNGIQVGVDSCLKFPWGKAKNMGIVSPGKSGLVNAGV